MFTVGLVLFIGSVWSFVWARPREGYADSYYIPRKNRQDLNLNLSHIRIGSYVGIVIGGALLFTGFSLGFALY